MDNLIYAFLVASLIVVIIDAIDQALILWIFGFLCAVFAWSISETFSITNSSYGGFGRIFILGVWALVIICFGKAALTSNTIIKEREV